MGPPTMVTFQQPLRGRDRSRIRDEDVSQLRFDETGSVSDTFYYKYHPFVWILLMLMAVTLHGSYQTLFDGGEPLSNYSFFAQADDRIQRQTSELDDNHDKAVDMSSLVMSLNQPGEPLTSIYSKLARGDDRIQRQTSELDDNHDKAVDMSSLVMSLIQPESEDSSTQRLLRGSSKLLPPAQDLSQVIQQEPEDDSVGDEKHRIQQASDSTESDATPLQYSADPNDNTRHTPSQIEETKGQ
jgi:hypothetical protein